MAGLLLLATAAPAETPNGGLITPDGLRCVVPKAPSISVTPQSDEIAYDFDRSSRELTVMKGGPAESAMGVDVTTGGLRVDQPMVAVNVRYGMADYPSLRQGCVWYDSATVNITLRPHIFIAKEYNVPGPCRDAIMAHELHHVDVDREMMNKYSYVMGEAVKKAVDDTGGIGPFADGEIDAQGQALIDKVTQAVREAEIPLRDEMTARQADVDSPAEYKRVSAICNNH
jgi:hypothetical protein